jgi:hypothetical protein
VEVQAALAVMFEHAWNILEYDEGTRSFLLDDGDALQRNDALTLRPPRCCSVMYTSLCTASAPTYGQRLLWRNELPWGRCTGFGA